MSKNADQIRSEIEQTRGSMGNTLEALSDRVAPKKVAARAKADVAERVDNVKQRLNPVGILRRGGSRSRDALESNGQTATYAGSSGGSGNGRNSGARTALAEAPSKLADKAGSATETIAQQASGNPLALGLLAFGAGMAVAGLLPPTDRERQVASLVKERVEPLKDQAREAGRSIMGELKPAAQSSIEQVKERTLGAVEQVKDEAKGAADELKEGARSKTQGIKQSTRSATTRVRSETKRSTSKVKTEAKSSARSAKQAIARPAASGRGRPATKTGTATTRSRSTKPAAARASAARASRSRA